MKLRKPKLLTAVLALLAAGLLAAPPAHANPNWELYNVDTSTHVAIGDLLTVDFLSTTLVSLVNGAGERIDCQGPTSSALLTHVMTAADQYSATPGASLSIPFTPASVISDSSHDHCRNTTGTTWAGGTTVDVTSSGADWVFTLAAPTLGWAGVYAGVLPATWTIPAGAISTWDPTIGCGMTLPSVNLVLTGSYDTTTGIFTATPNQALSASPVGSCTVTNTRLTVGSLQFDPIVSLIY